MTFAFNRPIQTPRGPAIFIGIMDGNRVQVSRRVPATELSKDECVARKPALEDASRDEFHAWQKSAVFCINEIYPLDQVRELDKQLELL